jgi:CHASE3 domain sensor protein
MADGPTTSDQLLAVADALDAWMDTNGNLPQDQAESLLAQSNALRSQAGAVLEDQVASALASLAIDQQDLVATIAQAKAQIAAIAEVQKLVPLVGAVILLATCLAGGAPGLAAALGGVRSQSQ